MQQWGFFGTGSLESEVNAIGVKVTVYVKQKYYGKTRNNIAINIAISGFSIYNDGNQSFSTLMKEGCEKDWVFI